MTAAVARHVRALRLARGWSLDELATRSRVSKGMVVQIEGGRTNPSVATLCRIADAFGIGVARLLDDADQRTVRVTTLDLAPVLWRGASGGLARLLAGLAEPGPVEVWEWRIQPRDRYAGTEHPAGTWQIVHVLLGEMIVTAGGREYLVGPGDTIEFRADRAHSARNEAGVPARAVAVVVSPAAGRAPEPS
ncbi:MAG TPA: XRE family transcriptional regulator [Micromonosporaceae bacterium]